jgi:dihydrofolate reductase (trimethoprim resistance protein)
VISLIAAVSSNGIIGCGGKIPWKLDHEQKIFRRLTEGGIVIMGRKTFESIGHALPHRITVVLSRTHSFSDADLVTCRSLGEAFGYAEEHFPSRPVFIAGGEAVYREALPFCSTLYITEVETQAEGDARFPDFDRSDFIKKESVRIEDDRLPYTFTEFTRKADRY